MLLCSLPNKNNFFNNPNFKDSLEESHTCKLIPCLHYNKIILKGMKRMTQFMSSYIQKNIALYTQEFINANFTNLIIHVTDVLQNNIKYFLTNGLDENIFKQTLVKNSFARQSFKKSLFKNFIKCLVSLINR